jgi:hypothetical protein
MFHAQTARATLPATPGAILSAPTAVWSTGSTSTPIFHPLTTRVATMSLVAMRISTEMSNDSGDCEMRPAVRFSDDGLEWDSSQNVHGATYLSTNSSSYPSSPESLATLTNPKAFIQFGVQVKNDGSSGEIQLCTAQIRVEVERP